MCLRLFVCIVRCLIVCDDLGQCISSPIFVLDSPWAAYGCLNIIISTLNWQACNRLVRHLTFQPLHSDPLTAYFDALPLLPSDPSCKPNFSQLIDGGGITPGSPAPTGAPAEDGAGFDTESIVGLVIWFVCVLYSSIRYGGIWDVLMGSGRGWLLEIVSLREMGVICW